ncbi:hypothetical protein P9112_001894 [Eukaryota sp. TZLM1-RC]
MGRRKLVTNSKLPLSSSSQRARNADNADESLTFNTIIENYKDWRPSYVCLSPLDSALDLPFSSDLLSVSGYHGHRMTLATHPASTGFWYYESVRGKGDGAIRIGWATRNAEIHASCGFDCFSFSLRDSDCSLFHQAKRYPSPLPRTLSKGDVIGCLIYQGVEVEGLKCECVNDFNIDRIGKDSSQIMYFINGELLNLAFVNFKITEYFPAASLFKNVDLDFKFDYPFRFKPDIPDLNPISSAFKPSDQPFYSIS